MYASISTGLLILILWVLHTRAPPSESVGLGSTLHEIDKSGNTEDSVGTAGMSRKFGAQDDLMTDLGLQNASATTEEYVL